jgi:hypothetical protein
MAAFSGGIMHISCICHLGQLGDISNQTRVAVHFFEKHGARAFHNRQIGKYLPAVILTIHCSVPHLSAVLNLNRELQAAVKGAAKGDAGKEKLELAVLCLYRACKLLKFSITKDRQWPVSPLKIALTR